jgi:hypothetical protein
MPLTVMTALRSQPQAGALTTPTVAAEEQAGRRQRGPDPILDPVWQR